MLGSAGCGSVRYETVRTPPEACPRPAPLTAADLPALDPDLPLDAPANVETLLRRHSLIKAAVRERERALDCYEVQTGPK
ncbi:MAG: hypothetical protein LBP61_01650 [Desulfovibrio sp.]|jgi:hypothetical protein|nr:hypothetical protein [Desulfovibrio sp.]